MSMAAKVASLREFFGVGEADLRAAISKMNEEMGIVGEGPLPVQVDKLVAETGVATAPAVAASAALAAASAASKSSLSTAPIEADVAAGVADDSTRYLLFQDNLDAQCKDRNPEYTEYLDRECNTDDHKVPPGKTDQVQPVDRGFGRQVKLYMGQEEDAWLEDDDNLMKWEGNQLTASDRRILIATWFFRACNRACEGAAKRKYFEHAGALMTADGTGDDLIKLEGVPLIEKFTFMEAPVARAAEAEALEDDEPDVAPSREAGDDEEALDEEDETDEEDAPPAPREPPPGFAFVSSPPSVSALAFSKEAATDADALVGRSILFHWAGIGWHVGTITRRNFDARRKRGGAVSNYYIHYQVDDDEGAAVLSVEAYGGDDESSWILLEPQPVTE